MPDAAAERGGEAQLACWLVVLLRGAPWLKVTVRKTSDYRGPEPKHRAQPETWATVGAAVSLTPMAESFRLDRSAFEALLSWAAQPQIPPRSPALIARPCYQPVVALHCPLCDRTLSVVRQTTAMALRTWVSAACGRNQQALGKVGPDWESTVTGLPARAWMRSTWRARSARRKPALAPRRISQN